MKGLSQNAHGCRGGDAPPAVKVRCVSYPGGRRIGAPKHVCALDSPLRHHLCTLHSALCTLLYHIFLPSRTFTPTTSLSPSVSPTIAARSAMGRGTPSTTSR